MEARILYTARLWHEDAQERGRVAMVVAQTDVEYRRPILFRPEAYDCWSWISHVGRRSMVVESEICDGDEVLSRARVVMVFFDRDDPAPGRPARGAARAAARRPRAGGHSRELTMNCAAWVT